MRYFKAKCSGDSPSGSDMAWLVGEAAVTHDFDVVGDVHGQFDKLVELPVHLGYRNTAGTWRHPDRMAIFVVDFRFSFLRGA
jgi:hypothetical protein